MASTFSSQQATHALFLLLPLNFPLLLIPNASVTKYNNVCDYFKKGENVKKAHHKIIFSLFCKTQVHAKLMTTCYAKKNLALC